MIVFMLSKDDEEFKRYKQGRLPHDKIIEVRGEKEEDKQCDAFVRCLGNDDKGNLCVLLILSLGTIAKTAKDTLKDNLAGDSSVDAKDFLSQLKKILVSLIKCTELNNDIKSFLTNAINFERSSPKCVTEDSLLFVHWGGGAPLEYEKRFKDCLEEHLKDENKPQFKSIRAYAFSSRRAELFDVTRSKIETPKTYDELVELENRFRNAQVDEAFAHCAAKHDYNISGTKKEIVDRLNRFAIRVLKSSLDTEKKKELLQSVAKAKNEKFDNSKDTSDETAVFFAKILNREVFNG